jgi:hypothetical protein
MSTQMNDDDVKRILADKPWMTLLTYGGNDYVGIIQNIDDTITTIYDYGSLKTPEQKLAFLELAEVWWMESNRLVPINVFLRVEWALFRPTLKTLNSKDVDIKLGPYLSLKEMSIRKTKRRSITLVRKLY